jgi:outer membrane lipoprotein SlyB
MTTKIRTKTKRFKSGLIAAALAFPMLAPIGSVSAHAQYQDNHQTYNRDTYNRDHVRSHDSGRRNVRGGYYQNGQYHPNGIGPGKGAAIGAGGGAVLGAALGGGKGALVGAGVGAGAGAVAGKAHQNHQKREHYDNRYPR